MTTYRAWLALVVPVLGLAWGCSASEGGDPVASACGGARPSFESCVAGSTWARCGGEEAPRFGCGGQRCFWFEGGCVAEGFEVSSCPADDLCCVPSGESGYPFDPPPSEPSEGGVDVTSFLVGWGATPWSRERARDVSVELAAREPIEGPTASCSPAGDPGFMRGICECPTEGMRQWSEGVLVAVVRSSCVAIPSWELSVEITRDDDDSLHARVCRVGTTDVGIAACPVPEREPVCADAGIITLDAFPDSAEAARSTRLDLSVSFPDGVTIDAQL